MNDLTEPGCACTCQVEDFYTTCAPTTLVLDNDKLNRLYEGREGTDFPLHGVDSLVLKFVNSTKLLKWFTTAKYTRLSELYFYECDFAEEQEIPEEQVEDANQEVAGFIQQNSMLKKISFEFTVLNANVLNSFVTIESLISITFVQSDYNFDKSDWKIVANISKLSNLEDLSLGSDSSEFFPSVFSENNVKLSSLKVSGSCSKSFIGEISKLQNLQKLNFSYESDNTEDSQVFKKLTSLQTLLVEMCTDQDLQFLSEVTTLKNIGFFDSVNEEKLCGIILQNPFLESVTLLSPFEKEQKNFKYFFEALKRVPLKELKLLSCSLFNDPFASDYIADFFQNSSVTSVGASHIKFPEKFVDFFTKKRNILQEVHIGISMFAHPSFSVTNLHATGSSHIFFLICDLLKSSNLERMSICLNEIDSKDDHIIIIINAMKKNFKLLNWDASSATVTRKCRNQFALNESMFCIFL